MAKKKKSVLDYDPLAWLNDQHEESGAQGTPVEVKETEPETHISSNDEGFGFFNESDDHQVVKPSTLESDGFGFFDDEDDSKNDNQAVDEGFGFFDEEPSIQQLANKTNDEGFGFFDDDEQIVANTDDVNNETLDISKEDAINLGSELTIKTVAEVKQQIDNQLSEDIDIVIDAEEMIKIDTAGLQLLYSLKMSLDKTGHHIKWIGTSSVINDSAQVIGMPILAPKSKEACYGFFEENIVPKDAEDGSSGFF